MHPTFDGRLDRLTRNPISGILLIAWGALSMSLVAVLGLVRFEQMAVPTALGLGWFALSLALSPLMRHLARKPRRSSVRVQIDRDGIRVDDERVVRRRHIRSGATYTAPDGTIRVVLRHRRTIGSTFFKENPALVFFAADASEANALLAAAGVDADRQVFRTTFLRPHARWQVVVPFLIYFLLSWSLFESLSRWPGPFEVPLVVMFPVLPPALAVGLYVLTARLSVTIGTDGVELRRPLRRRFIQLDEIRDVTIGPQALTITLASGEDVSLAHSVPFGEPVGSFDASDVGMERALLGARIADALRNHKRRHPSGNALLALARLSRSPDRWLASLRAIGLGASDYRTSVVGVEELRHLVADSTAATDVRIGAAVALRVAEGEAGVERIRVAAETTAAPELRDVLTDIADEADDTNLRRHLLRVR